MSKFNNGDHVIFNGSIPETFDEDFTVGQEYIVNDANYRTGRDYVGISVETLDGRFKVWMREGNFDLLPEEPVPSRPDNGDVMLVTHNANSSGFKETPVKVTLSRKTEDDYLATTDDGQGWYVTDDQLAPYVEPVVEKDSHVAKRKLLVASFEDRKGNTITIKRSKCRHYYLKKPGKPQVRIAKSKIGAILGELATSL